MPHKPVIIDGERYPSVTEISSIGEDPQGLINWYRDNTKEFCEKRTEESAQRGRDFHDAVEDWFDGKGLPKNDLEDPVNAVISWVLSVGFKPQALEEYVECSRELYGGTLDAWGYIDEEPVLIDWKLTGRISKKHIIQPVGYLLGLADNGMEVLQYRIVRPYKLNKPAKETKIEELKNTTKYSFKDSLWYVEEYRKYLKSLTMEEPFVRAFMYMRYVWDYRHDRGDFDAIRRERSEKDIQDVKP